jgi:hypothetical protein
MSRITKMRVVTVDENGNEVGDAEWVDIPEPDSFATDGFAHIQSYVVRVLNSSASFSSLIIATPDGQFAVSLWQRGGTPEFSVMVNGRQEPKREHAIREFFAARSLTPSQDYLAGDDATRCLSYVLPVNPPFVTELTRNVLQEIYGLRDEDALDFTYEEKGEEDEPA